MDVEVFKFVDGEPVERMLALTEEAQGGAHKAAVAKAQQAEAVLRSGQYSEGKSKITVDRLPDEEYGGIDWFVILDDSSDEDAAFQIEMGREGAKTVAPLRRAFGLGPYGGGG